MGSLSATFTDDEVLSQDLLWSLFFPWFGGMREEKEGSVKFLLS